MRSADILKRSNWFAVLLVVLFIHKTVSAQQINYENEFKKDYAKAYAYFEQNSWITDTLAKYNSPVEFTKAIVFPELVRYSVLRDQMEVGGLKILYISFGKDYADFSIGNFQMKPSFIEQLMDDLKVYKLDQLFSSLLIDTKDDEAYRRLVVKNLDNKQKQVIYLAAFFAICEKKFAARKWNTQEEKLKFYATAYNCGYWQKEAYIDQKMKQKFFSTDIISMGKSYNYADIAWYFFNAKTTANQKAKYKKQSL